MEEKSIEFLSKAANIIPPGVPHLRTHYLIKARCIAEANDFRLPANIFGNKSMCKFCGNIWTQTNCVVRLVPKIVPGKKMKKILHRKEKCPQLLRPYELKLLNKCEADKDNKLVIVCKVCNKKACTLLTKPEKIKPQSEEPESILVTPVKQKKKRKSKDKFAGLNSSIVSSVTPNILKSNKKSAKKMTQSDVNTSSTPLRAIDLHSPSVIKTPFTPLIQKKMSVKKQVKVAKEQMQAEKKEQLKHSAKKAKRCNTLHKLLTSEAMSPHTKTSLKDFLSSM